MKIVLLGTDNFSAVVLKAIVTRGDIVVAAFTHSKNKDYKRFQSICTYYKIPFHIVDSINSESTEKMMIVYEPDVIFTAHFDRILKPNIIKIPKLACINLHPSLLPKYRGMSPFQSVLRFGENETAISIHYIKEDVDTGDIIAQKRLLLTDDMYLFDLQKMMLDNYPEVVTDALAFIDAGRLDAVKQSTDCISYYGSISDDDRNLALCESVCDAYNTVRAMSRPFSGAFIGKYTVWRAQISKSKNPPPKSKNAILLTRQNYALFMPTASCTPKTETIL